EEVPAPEGRALGGEQLRRIQRLHHHQQGGLFRQPRRPPDAAEEGPGAAGPALFQCEEVKGFHSAHAVVRSFQRKRERADRASKHYTPSTILISRSAPLPSSFSADW